jgi:hypothetical protein
VSHAIGSVERLSRLAIGDELHSDHEPALPDVSDEWEPREIGESGLETFRPLSNT